MNNLDDLAQLRCIGGKRWTVQLRGYLKADKGGVFSADRTRVIAALLLKLADEADARNGVNLEGTSGVPYSSDEGTTTDASL